MVITGPFNFTKKAEEHNAGNLFIIYDKKLASLYVKTWQYQAQHSEVILQEGNKPHFFPSWSPRLKVPDQWCGFQIEIENEISQCYVYTI